MQPNFQTFIVNTPALFDSLKKYAEEVDSDLFVYDVETDSKIDRKAQLYGFGVAFTESKGFYIPWRSPTGELIWTLEQRLKIISWIEKMASEKKLIGHNIIYDVIVTEGNFGIDLSSKIYSDTILMKHTVEEEPPFGLKEICVEKFGTWADMAQDKLKNEVLAAGGRWTRDEKDMYLASTDTLGTYCCWDVLLTLMLFKDLQDKLDKENLNDLFYNQEVMPLYKEVTIDMKRKGFPVDVEYYNQLKTDLLNEIKTLEDDIMVLIKNDISKFEANLLDEHYPVKSSGNFPKIAADYFGYAMPINAKTNKVTLAAKALELQRAAEEKAGNIEAVEFFNDLIKGALDTNTKVKTEKAAIQKSMYFKDNPDCRYVFNLQSNDHLIELIFNQWGFSPEDKTPTGKPKIDDDYLESLKGNPVIEKLKDFKKLNKLLSTYVEGILDRQIDGVIYTSMLQFGTTSGRFSSRDPNLQNQPRIKDDDSGLSQLVLKYVNAIRRGFVAGLGCKIVNADYASLEPVCFAHVSGDEKLRNVFRNGEDLYSRVGIETFNISGVSAVKKDPNYLKNIHPEIRQTSKVIALAIPYGAEAARISQELGVSFREAQEIIDKYLNGFPELKKYMARQNYAAKTKGFVTTEFGRIRHLKEAKAIYTLYGENIIDWKFANKNQKLDIRRKIKNSLNNAKNFPIQGLAAHIVNRAMIAIARAFRKEGLDASIRLQVHDEITCIASEAHAQRASEIIKECMENTTKISVPLIAEPLIADNWAEAK